MDIARERLAPLRGVCVDEAEIGTRYIVATCEAALLNSSETDASALDWRQDFEDLRDRDPIVRAFWAPVAAVLDDGTVPGAREDLSHKRRLLLEVAVPHFVTSACGRAIASSGRGPC